MAVITNLLDNLAEKRLVINTLDIEIQARAQELWVERIRAQKEAEALEKLIKEKAAFIPESQQHTLKGQFLQLVSRITSKWDETQLVHLAGKYGIPLDELQACKANTHSWAICKRAR